MVSPAIEAITKSYPNVNIVFFGVSLVLPLYESHTNTLEVIEDESRKFSSFQRVSYLLKLARKLNEKTQFNYVVSFRRSLASRFLLWQLKATKSDYYRHKITAGHQVERYHQFIINAFDLSEMVPHKLHISKVIKKTYYKDKPIFAINAGATYGSAKRWYPEYFVEVAVALKDSHHILLLGGPSEVELVNSIENILKREKVTDFSNLSGKMSVSEMIDILSQVDLLLTNDSGPMHVATAFSIPLVAIFGPTKDHETSPWSHPQHRIVKQNLDCQPCMQPSCPLQHHNCMKNLLPNKVIPVLKCLVKGISK